MVAVHGAENHYVSAEMTRGAKIFHLPVIEYFLVNGDTSTYI